MQNLIYITGGARSGKSTFAEKLASHFYKKLNLKDNIAYIATGLPVDDEFKNRINAHKKRRSEIFTTYEEPLKIDTTVKDCLSNHSIILIECLTTWLGNIYADNKINNSKDFAFKTAGNILNILSREINNRINFDENINHKKLNNISKIKTGDKIIIAVSNEIGSGIVPANALIRNFRDELGKINQMIAASSDHSYLLTSGIPIKIK